MSKRFSLVEGTFQEPSELSNATLLGQFKLKYGSQILSTSNIAIAVASNDVHTYELSFTVAEDNREEDLVTYDVVLVKDLHSFEFDGPALIFGDLRGQGNCGGHMLLVSRSGNPIELFPALDTLHVKIYSKFAA